MLYYMKIMITDIQNFNEIDDKSIKGLQTISIN